MAKKISKKENFLKGIFSENPIFVQLLGMCPTLAVTSSAENGLAMGLATTFVLFCSSFIISIVRKLIPPQVRIATYIVIVATFVTIADIYLKGYFPAISKSLGPFIPLIVVNCVILGRAEAFASKHTVVDSIIDSLGMGSGFIISLVILSSIRELLGAGTVFGKVILSASYFKPMGIMVLPAGAFITLGLLLGLVNYVVLRKKARG